MTDFSLAITQPAHGSALTAAVALRGTAVGNTAGLFFKWFSSLNKDATETNPHIQPSDFSIATLNGTITALGEFGTHAVLLAATDRAGIDLPSIQAVTRAALAGGAPPAAPAPCVVHQLLGVTLRTPAANNAVLSKAACTIEFLAPGPWAKQLPLNTGPWLPNTDYQQINGVLLSLRLAPASGATPANSATLPLDLPALPFFRADDKTWLRRSGSLPANLGTGAHVLSLIASAGAASLTVTRPVVLSA